MATSASPAGVASTEQEIAVLGNVLHRLVITDDAKLSAVLDKLLPRLVRKLNDAPAVRGKVIDILSHVSKRARPNPAITLPCSQLLAVCRDVPPTSFAFNFSITFLEMGVPRLPAVEQGVVAAEIARGISRLQRYSMSQNILLNLLLVVLEHLPLRSDGDNGGSDSNQQHSAGGVSQVAAATAAVSATQKQLDVADLAVVTDWFLDVALYPGVLTREGSAYHGLSPAGLARLTMKEKTWPMELLTRRKLAVVRALKSDLFTPASVVVPALAAAAGTHHEVVKSAEDLLKSLSSSDRTGTLQRNSAVAADVLNLVLGGGSQAPPKPPPVPVGTGKAAVQTTAGVSPARSPASAALAVRALAWLESECPAGTAARVKEAVQVSFLALFTGVSSGAPPSGPGAAHRDRANEARFRAAGARLAAFIASRCDVAVLPMVGPLLLQAVQKVLTMNAAPAGSEGAGGLSADSQSKGASGTSGALSVGASLSMQIQHTAMLEACYESVASIAVRRPALFEGDTSMPRLLFSELSAKEPGLRVKISAALGALKGAYKVAGRTIHSELWFLLWGAATSVEHRARLCAVEWACELFDFSNVAARRLCISLCDDKVTAVRSVASRGLHPPPHTTPVASDGTTGNDIRGRSSSYPTFSAFVLGALRDDNASAMARGGGPAPVNCKDLPPAALARALDFALECRGAQSYPHQHINTDSSSSSVTASMEYEGAENEVEAVDVFISLIESTLKSAPSATDGQHGHAQMVLLHRSASVALKKMAVGGSSTGVVSPAAQGAAVADKVGGGSETSTLLPPAIGVAKKLASRGPWLQQWLGHEASTEIREAFAEITGAAAMFMDPNGELVPLLRALRLKLEPCTMAGAAGFSNRAISTGHGAACAIGSTLTRLAEASAAGDSKWEALSADTLPMTLSSVVAVIGHPVSLLHVAACHAIGRVGAVGALSLPSGAADDGKSTSRTGVGGDGGALGDGRFTTVAEVFERLWTACKLGETTDASRRAEAAAESLGKLCLGARRGTVEDEKAGTVTKMAHKESSTRLRKTLTVMFDLAKSQNQEELQFAVGGAVADVACSGALFMPAGSVLEAMRASARVARREMKEVTVVADTSSSEEKEHGKEDGGAFVDALDYVLYQVLYVLLEDHSPHVSGAAAVYLLALVQRCKGHPALTAYLADVQAAFTRKLTVRSEFVQEVAGKGLALVYQAATGDSKQALVDSLVDALSTGRRRATGGGGVDVHGGTHAGAALSEAGAGAYGQMCAVANDVGRPDLIYSFLSMASHHSAWTTRRGASYGLGVMIDQVSPGAFGDQLRRIVPRLFRYRFDPSAKTRSAMEQLWRSIVGGGGRGVAADFSIREKEVIRTNLSAIITELIRALGERKWRDRQSACAGLADVLRGRGWDELGPHLEDLWIMADRALDDIKESVAEQAVDFAKTLANVSVRLCDPYTFVPPHGEDVDAAGSAAAAAAAAAARSDAAGQGSDALREEANEARRTIGTMVEDFTASEAEASARGEGGMQVPPGLSSAQERDAAVDEVLRHVAAAAGPEAAAATGEGGIGRTLGGGERRNGPTAADILRPGRAGAERTGPPPSAAAREAAAAAIAVTLPWLMRKGILSRCKASQGLAMRTLQRLVKVCDKESLTPHLAELVATLIEGLSALEPQALQYMQFHAETQLEMTQDQMERLRLSVSRAGPLQDALDQCYRHLDGVGVVADLMPRLLGLLRSGTGLATRSASAYLVLSLCERAPADTSKAAPKLLPTLTNAALSERSSTLRRTYSSALSTVARLAPAAGVSHLASRLAQLFREADPDFDKRQRRTLALLLGDLCRRAGGQLGAGADSQGSGGSGAITFGASGWARILPVAFVARRDPDKPVADAFEQAWQEGLMQLQLGAAGMGESARVRTAKDAVLLMLPAVLAEVSAAISSVSRVTKRQGCSGLKDLASTLGSALGEASSGRRLIRRVLSHMHGRTWEGKEELLEAVVALCKAGKGSAISLEPFAWAEAPASTTGNSEGASRGLKRTRSEEIIGDGPQDETEAEDDGEGSTVVGEEDDKTPGAVAPDVSGGSTNDLGGSVGTAGEISRATAGGTAQTRAETGQRGSEDEGSADGDDAKNEDGTEAAFLYQNKLGFVEGGTAVDDGVDATTSGAAVAAATLPPAATGIAERKPQTSSTASGEGKGGQAPLDDEDDSAIPFGEVVGLMLPQLNRKNTKFRRSAAVSLAALLTAFPECCVYEMVAPTLLRLAGLIGPPGPAQGESNSDDHGKEDPIMQARAVSALAAAWPCMPPPQPTQPSARTYRQDMPSGQESGGDAGQGDTGDVAVAVGTAAAATREVVYGVQRRHAASLTRALTEAMTRKVWSVRVPILHALAAVVSRTYSPPVAGTAAGTDEGSRGSKMGIILTSALLATVVETIEVGAEDVKYSQVRAAANSVVFVMTSRKELQLALMPHKEGLVAIARSGAEDPEPRVAMEGSKAAQNLAWWP